MAGPLHSKKRDSQAVRYHYDLPREFFALFLGNSMQYSSAYFHRWDEHDLDAAQERKLDYICRKLRLCQGETLLDIGCGWGGLLTYAASHYGVRAVGITLSISQADAARERIRSAGLNQQCRVEVCDYRDLESDQLFDKIVSVGMFEHVGEKLLPDFFLMASQRLKPGGLFLNSGVSANAMEHRRGASFVDRYVFPDGDLVPISTSLTAAEGAGFEVRDLENFREHYGLTLRQWVRRLEEHAGPGSAPERRDYVSHLALVYGGIGSSISCRALEQLSYVAVERLTRGRPAAHPAWLVLRLRKHIHGGACSLLGMMQFLACSCLLLILHSSVAAQSPGISANDLARRVIENELRAEDQDNSHWMFRIETRKPDSGSEVDAVIQTPKGELQLPVLINGHPPAKTEEEKAETRIQHREQSGGRAKVAKEKSEDYSRSRRMLKMLPEAFIYTYGARQGDRVQLNFKPNPHFRSHSFEEEVFHAMDGSLWVDEKQNRLAEMSGHLTNGVKFLGGLLGHLDKGGSFEVKQEPVAPGYWELTVLNVHMTGRALFFKTISEQQRFYRSEFKRVPDNLTLAQADELLKKEVASYRNRLQEKQGF